MRENVRFQWIKHLCWQSQMKLPVKPVKFCPKEKKKKTCESSALAAGSFGLLTALCGKLAVELRKLSFHWNTDGASQEMGPGWRNAPPLQKNPTTNKQKKTWSVILSQLNQYHKIDRSTTKDNKSYIAQTTVTKGLIAVAVVILSTVLDAVLGRRLTMAVVTLMNECLLFWAEQTLAVHQSVSDFSLPVARIEDDWKHKREKKRVVMKQRPGVLLWWR